MLQQVDRVEGLQRVNDFVVKFANVNGSGSASANSLFARAVLRMGVASTPRNIFPSNIQGLPTWYEVRVSEAGHLGARGGGVDLMVAMNPQTWDEDVRSIVPGGYLFYDNTKPMPSSKFREDIIVLGVPLTEMSNAAYSDPRQRQLFKNIVGLGALATLLDMDVPAIEQLLSDQFKGRDKLIAANVQALHMGIDWVKANMVADRRGEAGLFDQTGDDLGRQRIAAEMAHVPPPAEQIFEAGAKRRIELRRARFGVVVHGPNLAHVRARGHLSAGRQRPRPLARRQAQG